MQLLIAIPSPVLEKPGTYSQMHRAHLIPKFMPTAEHSNQNKMGSSAVRSGRLQCGS